MDLYSVCGKPWLCLFFWGGGERKGSTGSGSQNKVPDAWPDVPGAAYTMKLNELVLNSDLNSKSMYPGLDEYCIVESQGVNSPTHELSEVLNIDASPKADQRFSDSRLRRLESSGTVQSFWTITKRTIWKFCNLPKIISMQASKVAEVGNRRVPNYKGKGCVLYYAGGNVNPRAL
ncbi:hypothetical protein B0H10DRAFT_2202557 [Mycena sp. CBHHK59/15]|nr:hypothetical protein B0H10DRAFT_2203734 [Mycena sp. CBHHK59/15]KAJ6546637.1 hypothetical protein B0H10DRAFT_1969546 [Mycena sp. CBHHK59/15]KAJ6548266.1 hypothetical protein B0H10DRAFT_2202557 [Mycena sp. CBHHK59/15]